MELIEIAHREIAESYIPVVVLMVIMRENSCTALILCQALICIALSTRQAMFYVMYT